jgi:hypothetical protein
MTIPAFDHNGNLPPGVYRTTMAEIATRFAWNEKRRRLSEGLGRALANLAAAGVKEVWIAGGFVSSKDEPNDVDGCWDYTPAALDVSKLDPVFLDTAPPRDAMKRAYGVDFLISWRRLADPEAHGATVLEFFQKDQDGNPKGILLLKLG